MGAATGLMMPAWANATSSMVTQMHNADALRAQAELEAASLEAKADKKDWEAQASLAAGRQAVSTHQRESRLDLAADRARFGASGVKVNEGSPVEAMADKAAWSEYERQTIDYQSRLESWGLKYDAAALRTEAANTRQAARVAGQNAQANSLVSLTGKNSILDWLTT